MQLGWWKGFHRSGTCRRADAAAKSAEVMLFRIYVVMAIGGKGYVMMTGDFASVEAAVAAFRCCSRGGHSGVANCHRTAAERAVSRVGVTPLRCDGDTDAFRSAPDDAQLLLPDKVCVDPFVQHVEFASGWNRRVAGDLGERFAA
jgi:hypothetical protein